MNDLISIGEMCAHRILKYVDGPVDLSHLLQTCTTMYRVVRNLPKRKGEMKHWVGWNKWGGDFNVKDMAYWCELGVGIDACTKDGRILDTVMKEATGECTFEEMKFICSELRLKL
eukprot:m.115888 g.115888  ORF g.115888 m.115888 type:complete len:115 (+) comp9296_c3_seq4:197-541(+)